MTATLPDLELPLAVVLVAMVVVSAWALVREWRRDRAVETDAVLDFGRVRWQHKDPT